MQEIEITPDFARWPTPELNPPYLPLENIAGDPNNYSGSYVTLKGTARLRVTSCEAAGQREAVVTAHADFFIQETDSQGRPFGDVTTWGQGPRVSGRAPEYPRDAKHFEWELYRIRADYFHGLKGMTLETSDHINWTEVPGQFKQFETPRAEPNHGQITANGVVRRWWFDTTGGHALIFLNRIVALIR